MRGKLSERKIKKRLKEGLEIICLDTTDSTNNEAKRELENGRSAPLLIAAREQTAGRGRQGKSFYSPKDTGVYMTLCLPVNENSGSFLSITSAAAVAVCRAIESLGSARPRIKWVNDIYVENRKVCGILCERFGDFVIIGIGINLTTSVFPKDIKRAGALGYGDTNALVAEITNQLLSLKDCSYPDFIEEYRSRLLLTGKRITFIKNGGTLHGLALGVDESCGLMVRLESGEEITLTSGEISITEF